MSGQPCGACGRRYCWKKLLLRRAWRLYIRHITHPAASPVTAEANNTEETK